MQKLKDKDAKQIVHVVGVFGEPVDYASFKQSNGFIDDNLQISFSLKYFHYPMDSTQKT